MIALIEEKRNKEAQRYIKKFEEEPGLEILNGRYGPFYIGNMTPEDLEKIPEPWYKELATVGEFQWMKVNQVTNAGAFLEWGLMKELLVPYREQKAEMIAEQ